MSTSTKFGFTLFATILFALVIASFSMGYSSVDGSLDLGYGVGTVWSFFGGLSSFGALVAIIVGVLVAVFGLVFMTNKDYTNEVKSQVAHVSIALAALGAAALIGLKWFKMPSGAGWAMLITIALLTGFTFLVMYINRHTRTVHAVRVPPTTIP